GGVFVSSPAYADGYVDGTGNNIYYGFKTDAQYAEAHFNIDVEYYDTFEHAKAGGTTGIDPLGKYVRVHYLSNSKNQGGTADNWRFRPMWWFGVPAGLKDPQDIQFKRIEKLTQNGKEQVKPAGSSQYITTDDNGYGVVSDKHFNNPKQWNNISNYYFSDQNILASKGWKQLMGLDDKGSKGYDDKGNTAQQWGEYQNQTQGLKGIFVDWESAGQRWYDMTYVSEMEDTAWKERDKNPLRFAAGVYRFAGNWHYAVGQKHNTPRIADHIDLKYPELTPVKDLKNVSTDEQNAIKDKIATANKDTKHYSDLVDKVEVSDKGVATITFKDKSTRTISADLLVFKNEEDKDKYKPVMPARTPVVNPSKLTDKDKTAVLKAFKDANKDNKDFNEHVKTDPDGIKFNDDGTKLIVTYQDGSKLEIDASELVCQGATIADWAPYVVPDIIDVDNLNQLKPDEITKIIKAFDDANTGITPYDESKTKNGKAPVEVNKTTGDATITWEDGSTTTISAWQFLKEKPKAPSPDPQPPAPTPAAEKEFIVEAPQKQINVKFDPFNMTEADLTTYSQSTLNPDKNGLKKVKGKDAKDNSEVTITDVSYSVKDGKGFITFKADGYKDATYPMSVFFKQTINTQTPTPDTNLHHPGQMTAYNYYVDPVQVDNVSSPSPQDQIAAFKKFMKKNYNVDITDQEARSAYTLKENDKPVAGVTNMQRYVKGENNGAGVVSFSLNQDGTIAVQGFESGENSSRKLFDVPLKDLYVAKSQQQKDNTIDHLKDQAKALLDKRRNTDKLTNDDLKRAGIEKPDELNDAKIDEIAKGQTAEKDLRDLIRKLTDAKKAERKYNSIPEIEVTDPANPSEADFKKAVEAFLKANYDGTDSLAVDKVPYTVPTSLKPKTNTVLMEPASDTNATGISSIKYKNSDFKTLIFTDKNNNQLFTVSVTYKKKAETPAPTPDALAQMKKDAKQQIDRNPNLTDDQKKQYEKDIDNASTPEDIKKILDKAAQQGKDNQNDPSKKQTITDNKGGGNAKKEAEKKQKENEEKQKEQKLQEEKKKASDEIDKLDNLSDEEKKALKKEINGDGTGADPNGATTPEAVQKILDKAKAIDGAKGALQNDIKKGALPFLDHGTGDKNNTADTHADDAALNELLGTKPGKDSTITALEAALAKKDPAATADELNKAVTAAKKANALNEQKAKDAANKQLTEKKDALDNAYNALTSDKQAAATDKYDAAVKAINDAKTNVDKATKPSDIKTALEGVKTSFDDANKAIENAKGQRDTTGNTNDDQNALKQEKEKQITRINNSGLSDGDKKKAIDDINAATKLGDPTGIADRALKAKKIEDAKKQIAALDHLNNAQKKAYEDIINSTDAHNIKDDDGKDTGKDDIDNALADAIATDTAMARLEKLKEIADKFATGDKYKNGDADKKTAFDDASTAAGAVLDKANGDAKNADQVNNLYNDLLKAMRDIDPNAQSAGVNTDALSKEIESDKTFKPSEADPKTPGDPVYNTSSKEKKDAFDQALNEAETALKTAEDAKKQMSAEEEATAQKAVDEALDKLVKARLALDGVDTKPLEQQIAKDADIKKSVRYTKASEDKQKAYDEALKAAQDLIKNLTTPSADGTTPKYGETKLDTKENKQKALNEALAKLKAAEEALNGKEPTPTPTPTPADVDKTDLAAELSKADTLERYISYLISSSDKQDAYNDALAEARRVYRDPNATQEQVNAAAAALRAAAAALSGYGSVDNDVNPLPIPSPLPNPVPGGAGFGVNDNAPTTVNKGELNIQIDSAEADSKPGNAGDGAGNGNANAGNANAGNAGNAGSAPNAQGGAGASAGAGAGAGTTGAAPAGVDNKAVNKAVENAPEVKQADVAVKQAAAALDDALAQAKRVAADPHATQAQVDAAARRLADARKALADAKANAANVRAAVRNRVIKNMRSRGGAGIATGADVATAGLMATMLAAIGGAFATRRMRTKHANRD
ncbi:GA module-containing protein, partial [Gardnerella vaginalis]